MESFPSGIVGRSNWLGAGWGRSAVSELVLGQDPRRLAPRYTSAEAVAAAEAVAPDWSRRRHIAPVERTWRGVAPRRPADFPVTVMLPVWRPGAALSLVVELWRRQTVRPLLCVVDTGSPRADLLGLWDRFDGHPDVEIHAVRSHGYQASSEPVTMAIDVALAVCQTEWLLLSHDDVFPRRRDLVEFLQWCSRRQAAPVVGWEMSDRSWITDEWRGMVSHTCTLLHVPSLHGCTWSMRRSQEEFRIAAPPAVGQWPDTETGFNYLLRARGITPLLLGPEVNFVRQVTRWWDHCRSFTGSRLYNSEYHAQAQGWLAEAVQAGRERLSAWTAAPAPPATAAS
jgi:hypothetical protein